MKIKNTTKRKAPKVIIAAIITLLLLGTAVFAYFYFITPQTDNTRQIRPTGEVDYNPATEEQIKAGADQKGRNQTDSPSPDKEGDISITITSINATSSSLQLRTELLLISNTGTCTLTLKKGNTTITKEVGIQAGPTTSTCKGFDMNEALSSGVWTATVSVVSGERSGTTSQEFTVE